MQLFPFQNNVGKSRLIQFPDILTKEIWMFVFYRVDSNLVLLVATSLIPVAMFVVSFCKVLAGLGIVLAIMGLNMGCIDCLANLQMIQLYGQSVSPFLQVSIITL